MARKLKAALYLRASSQKQVEKDISIPAQRDAGLAFIEKKGWLLHDIYIDEGVSGTHARRPEFQRLLGQAQLEPPPFDVIVVWRLNRFARNREISVVYKAMLRRNGIALESITQNISEDNFSTALMEAVTEVVDEHFSKDLGRDTKRGMIKVAKEGYYSMGGRPPFGYSVETVKLGKSTRRKLIVNEEEATIIRRVFEMATKDNNGALKIAKTLNEDGIRYRGDRKFSAKTILTFLRNQVYTGCQVWNRTCKEYGRRVAENPDEIIRVENTHEALVSKETFELANEMIAERFHGKIPGSSIDSRFLLSGLIRCGECGSPMVGTSAKSGKYDYYVCNSIRRKGASSCECPALSKSKLEGFVLERFRRDIFTDENIGRFVVEVNDALFEQCNMRRKESEFLSRSLADAKERLRKLYEALETTDVDPKLIAPRLAEVIGEKEELERRLLQAETLEVPPLDSEKIKQHVADMRGLLFEGDFMRHRAFIVRFVEAIQIKRSPLAFGDGSAQAPEGTSHEQKAVAENKANLDEKTAVSASTGDSEIKRASSKKATGRKQKAVAAKKSAPQEQTGQVAIRYTLPLSAGVRGVDSPGGRLGNPREENREIRAVLPGVKYASPEIQKGEPFCELRACWEDGGTIRHKTIVPKKMKF